MRRIVRLLLVLAALGSAAACGGDGGPALTADEYAAQGNAVCKAGDAKLAEESKNLLKGINTTPDEAVAFLKDKAIPIAREKLSGLAKLKPPSKNKAKVKTMLAAGRKATDLYEKGLKDSGASYQAPKDAFKGFDDLAKELKLTDCAASSK